MHLMCRLAEQKSNKKNCQIYFPGEGYFRETNKK